MTTSSRPRHTTPRGLVLIGAALLAGAGASTAQANEGNLYGQGAGPFSTGPLASAAQVNPATVQVNAAATTSAAPGTAWSMGWGCPVPGSEIASISWSALRHAAASNADIQVTANGQRVWAEGDVGMPQSPAGGRDYGLGLPGGVCDLHLELVQTMRRQQHARVWWIGGPGVVVRDVAAPAAAIVSTPAGWVHDGQNTTRVGWQASDNFGSDGIAGQRISVDGQVRWAGAPGQGQHDTDLRLDGIADGTHTIGLEVDGDGTGGAGSQATVHLDRTAPEMGDLGTGYVGTTGRAEISWTTSDATSGLVNATAEVNSSISGSTAGPWTPVASVGRASSGQRVARTMGPGLGDGLHSWRVTARDEAGNVTQQAAPEQIVVDTTPPRIDLVPIPAAWTSTLPLDVTLRDNLENVLGLGDLEVEVNTSGDGSIRGEWIPLSQDSHAPGREVMDVPLTGLADGVHVVRLRLRNGGPFSTTLVGQRMGLVRTDLTAPDVPRAALASLPDGRVRMTWTAEDSRSGVEKVRLQWLDGWTWRTLVERPASDGSGVMSLDPALIPEPDGRMRVQVTDVAGNSRAMEVVAPAGGGGGTAPGAAPPPPAGAPVASAPGRMADEAREGVLTLGLVGGAPEVKEGVTYRTTRIPYGTAITVTGRLTTRAGAPRPDFTVVARQNGRQVGVAITEPDGTFRMKATPFQSGPVDVGVPDGSAVVPVPTGPRVGVHVRATVTMAASAHEARATGAPVVFRGRIGPPPGASGGRKAIVLEWLDPFRKVWRPVVNARAKADGSFAIPWRFQARGLTVPFRVRVPRERGWPVEAGTSGTVTVRVR